MKISFFHKSVAILLSGTAISQLIGIAVLPILTRLYTTEQMGLLAVYTAIVTILLTVVCMRLESAIPIQKDDKDAKSVLYLCIQISIVTSLIVLLCIIVTKFYFYEVLGDFSNYLLYVPIGMFIGGVYISVNAYALKCEKFELVSKSRMMQAFSCSLVQLSGVMVYQSAIWLIVGFILNLGAGINYLKNKLELKRLFRFESINKNKSIIARNINFPKFSVVESLSNAAGVQVPILLIAYSLSVSEAAFLFLAMKLIQAPMALLGSSISQVYYSQASAELLKGKLAEFTENVLRTAFKIGVGPIIAISILAPTVTEKILGSEWSAVGNYIFLMAPWFVIQFISSPISPIMYVKNKQKGFMFLTLFGLIWKLGLTVLAVVYGSYVVEVLVFANIIFYLICFFVFTRAADISTFSLIRIFLSSSLSIMSWIALGFVLLMLLNFFGH